MLPQAHGYTDSRGILLRPPRGRLALRGLPGFPEVDVDDVFLGNGVSELITMAMQALLEDGDEVLIPAPDYPLWTAVTSLAGGTPVHYLCDEQTGWQPDLDDIRSQGHAAHQGHRHHQPEQPDRRGLLARGARGHRRHRPRARAAGARRRDLRPDPVRRRRAHPAWPRSPPTCCASPSTASPRRTAWPATARAGWSITGPSEHATGFLEGITLLASMRLCPNVPAQHAVQAALGGVQSHRRADRAGRPAARAARRRLGGAQRDPRRLLRQAARARSTRSRGSTRRSTRSATTSKLVYDLLVSEQILLVQGTGFNWPTPDHFRIVTSPTRASSRMRIGYLRTTSSCSRQPPAAVGRTGEYALSPRTR